MVHSGKQWLADLEGKGLPQQFGLPGYIHTEGLDEAMEKPQKDEGISMGDPEHYNRQDPGEHCCQFSDTLN